MPPRRRRFRASSTSCKFRPASLCRRRIFGQRSRAAMRWRWKGTKPMRSSRARVKRDGSFRVDRIVCAVDCGVAVNPDVIRAQMEGGIGYGLSAALHGAITLKVSPPVAQYVFTDVVLRD